MAYLSKKTAQFILYTLFKNDVAIRHAKLQKIIPFTFSISLLHISAESCVSKQVSE